MLMLHSAGGVRYFLPGLPEYWTLQLCAPLISLADHCLRQIEQSDDQNQGPAFDAVATNSRTALMAVSLFWLGQKRGITL
ncbi:MAG TPA: hypothetical protein DCS30_18490 [Rhizobiales bacterium]|nr:hypothetical protein [Hyphomicrobiales bacterium]